MDRDTERAAVVAAIEEAGGNITRAAEKLGCSRRTLFSRMREFKLPHGRGGRRRRLLPYGGAPKRGRWVAAAAAAAGLVVGAAFLGGKAGA